MDWGLTRSHESLISGSSSFTLCRNCPFSFSRETILSLALTCRCSRLRRRISRLCISSFDSSILTVYQRVWLGVWIVTGVVIWKRELGTTTHFFSNGSSGVFEPLSGRLSRREPPSFPSGFPNGGGLCAHWVGRSPTCTHAGFRGKHRGSVSGPCGFN